MRQSAGWAGTVRRARGGAVGAVAVAAALLLAACGSSDAKGDDTTTTKAPAGTTTTDEATTTDPEATTTTAAGNVDQLDGAFVSSEVSGYDLAPDSEITLTFDGDTLSVNAGCNTMSSTYALEASVLKWTGTPAATMMACDDALEAQDRWITDLLTEGMDAEGTDGGADLVLTSGDVSITFAAVPVRGDAASSLPAGADPPTLTIDEEGTVGVFAGCNSGSGTVEITDTTLTFSPIALTRMACETDQTFLENQVVAVLDGEVDYTVEGATLTIENGSKGLVYTAS